MNSTSMVIESRKYQEIRNGLTSMSAMMDAFSASLRVRVTASAAAFVNSRYLPARKTDQCYESTLHNDGTVQTNKQNINCLPLPIWN